MDGAPWFTVDGWMDWDGSLCGVKYGAHYLDCEIAFLKKENKP